MCLSSPLEGKGSNLSLFFCPPSTLIGIVLRSGHVKGSYKAIALALFCNASQISLYIFKIFAFCNSLQCND
jgi:hypothetical protein